MSKLATQPLRISEIISQSIKFSAAGYGKTWIYAFLFALLGLLSLIALKFPVASTQAAIIAGLVACVWLIIATIFAVGTYVALVEKSQAFLADQDVQSTGNAIMHGLKLFWPVSVAVVLAYLSLIVGYIFLVIPGIFLTVALFIYLPLVIIEKNDVLAAYQQSVALTWDNWWRTLLIMLFIGLCYCLLYALVWLLVSVLMGYHFIYYSDNDHHFHFMLIKGVLHLILTTILLPWTTMLCLILINDFKLRKAT